MPTRDRVSSIMMCHSAPYEKSKSLGSGGSMVARLKLKGIDGRAPPGVNFYSFAAVTLHRTAARKGEVVQARDASNCALESKC
jgi:hypothetical protein